MDITEVTEFILPIVFIIIGFTFGYVFFDKNVNISLIFIAFMLIIGNLFDIVNDALFIIAVVIIIMVLFINFKKSET